MEKIKSYKELHVWEKAIELAKIVYTITEKIPHKEIFGLTSQMKRAAVSIPSNIAEGQARHYTKEFVQFLHQALGSLAELDTQTLIAKELNYINVNDKSEIENRINELQKMLHGLLKKLSASRYSLATNH